MLAVETDLWTDSTWMVDSTPVERARSRGAAKRSELAGWVGYVYCASHSRFFWGLRLSAHRPGLPITWALANPNSRTAKSLMTVLDHDPSVLTDRPDLLIIATALNTQPSTRSNPSAS